MAPEGKSLGFYREGNDWFINAGLPSDITVVVNTVNFHLHKLNFVTVFVLNLHHGT